MANDIRPDSLTILQANLFKWTSWDIYMHIYGEGGGVYTVPIWCTKGHGDLPYTPAY